MEHPVAEFERVGAAGQGGVNRLRNLRNVLRVNTLQPRLVRGADLVLVATDQAEPAGRKADPVGNQVPIPEPFTLPANADGI